MYFPRHILSLFYRFVSALSYEFEGTYTAKLLANIEDLLSQLWYFFLAAVAIAALLSLLFSEKKLSKSLTNTTKSAVFLACVLGVVSPLPTFAAIPLVAALFCRGVPLPPLIAFLIASPLMNPSLFVLTAGAMGLKMALARTVSAFLLAGSAGAFVSYSLRKNLFFPVVKREKIKAQQTSLSPEKQVSSSPPENKARRRFRLFRSQFWQMFKFMGKYFFLGVFIAAVVQTFLPVEWVVSLLGRQSRFAVLIAVAMGVPLYACGGGSIPIIEVLLRMGMNQGAALGFFISGPATKFSTLFTLYACFKGKLVTFYLLITLVGAAVLGYIYALVT